jgi:hypothetical protein
MTETTLSDILKRIEPKMSEANIKFISHQTWLDIWHMNISTNTRKANDMWHSLVSMKAFVQMNKTSFKIDYDKILSIISKEDLVLDISEPTDEAGLNDAKRYGVVP